DDADLAQPARGERIVEGGLRGAGDQQARLEVLGGSLDAAAEVDRVAESAVFEFNFRADIADLGDAAVDADAEREWFLQRRLPALVHLWQRFEHGEGGLAGAAGVVRLIVGSAP